MNNSEFFGKQPMVQEDAYEEQMHIEQPFSQIQTVKNKDVNNMSKFLPKKKEIFGNDKPWRLAIVSSSGSGKSFLINNMLTDPSFGLRDKFKPDRIFIFSPTAQNLDDSYNMIMNDLKKRSTKDHEFNQETQMFDEDLDQNLKLVYDTIYEEQLGRKKAKLPLEPSLIILDDILGSMDIAKNTSFLGQILTKIRHLNCSIIISVQYLKSFSPQARAQLSSIITFSIALAPEVTKLYQETAGSLSKKEWFNVYSYCTNQPYSYMLVMQNYPQQYKFFRGQGTELHQLQI